MKRLVLGLAMVLTAAPIWAAKPCEELKSEITTKLEAKGVQSYTLDIVAADSVKDEKVVGSCEAGTKTIVYKRGAAAPEKAPAPAAAPAPAPAAAAPAAAPAPAPKH